MYEVKIIKDSISSVGKRLTTVQVTHPRVIHSEMMTHRMFARCASSSRAIPFAKAVQKVKDDPFIPVHFGLNEKGMAASQELPAELRPQAVAKWLAARDLMIEAATELADPNGLNIHKQIVNRILEPWSWITVCITGDAGAWSNYFTLRCHPAAQPEIQKQAYMARDAYFASTPELLADGEWHLPYIEAEDRELAKAFDPGQATQVLVKASMGRAARTSYLSQEGKRDLAADIVLHDRLVSSRPLHASPAEHVCQATGDNARYGCFTGWKSYRYTLPFEYVTDYTPPKD